MGHPNNYAEFQDSLSEQNPPTNWPRGLKALWYDAEGNWEGSHDIAQEMNDNLGSWIHAYLHRKEGDEFNAGYWYRRAGRAFPNITLEKEHRELVEYVLNKK